MPAPSGSSAVALCCALAASLLASSVLAEPDCLSLDPADMCGDPPHCPRAEVCNLVDDDCDGLIDEYGAPPGGIEGAAMEVESWTNSAPPDLVATEADFEGNTFYDVVPNGIERCYRARTVTGDVVSGWSNVECTTPAVDPVPPEIHEVDRVPDGGKKLVKIRLGFTDSVDPDAVEIVGDLGVASSGVAQIRFDTTPSFEHAKWGSVKAALAVSPSSTIGLDWQPTAQRLTVARKDKGLIFKSAPPVRLEVWVQARDAAGNEGAPFAMELSLP